MCKREKIIRRGFSLPELLVVIAVMILLLSIAVPSVSNLMNAGRADAALGSLGAAIAATRSYSGRNPYGITYRGVALIITPANELRVVEHFDTITTGPTNVNQWDCYRDIKDEGYIRIPSGVGLVGITRVNNAGTSELRLLAPPFAIKFNTQGQLVMRAGSEGFVVYDGQYEQVAAAANLEGPFRPAEQQYFDVPYGNGSSNVDKGTREDVDDYDPSNWDPTIIGKVTGTSAEGKAATANFHADGTNNSVKKYMLPFDTIEPVIGVIAYVKQDFKDAMKSVSGVDADQPFAAKGGYVTDGGDEAGQWLLDNGKVYFFNRYSGAIIKP